MATVTEPVDIALGLLKGSNDPPYDPDKPYWQDPNWKNYADPDPRGAFGIPQSTWDEIAAGQEEEGNKVETPQEIAMKVFNERTENVYDSPDTHCQLHGERLQPIVDPQSIRQFPKGADENMYCTACEQNITNESVDMEFMSRQPQQFDIDEDTRRKLTGEPMDIAMRLLKQEDTLDYKCPQCGGQGGEWEGDDDGFIDYNDPDYFTSCWDCQGTGYLEPTHHPGQENQGAVGADVFDIRDEQHRQEYDVENAMPYGNKVVVHGDGEILDPKRMGFSRDGRMKQTAHPIAPQEIIESEHPALRHRLPTIYTREWDGRPTNRGLNITGRGGSDFKRGEPMDIAMRLLKAKSKGQESLTEWTKEKWEFVGDDKKEMKKPRHKRGRYAPKSVADSMSPSQKATENKTKRTAHKKGKQHAPRGKSVKQMYRSVEGKK